MNAHHCGFISIIGRPNVGKSTLVNRLIGTKVSITSSKPQTTRHRILGILTTTDAQMIFVDTPGLHRNRQTAINTIINNVARDSVFGVDVILLMITAKGWDPEDDMVLDAAKESKSPIVLAINKVDLLKNKSLILPLIKSVSEKYDFADIIPISASNGYNQDRLIEVLKKYLPEGPPGFPEDQVTDRGTRFQVSEIIREKVFRVVGQEIPYATAVEIDRLTKKKGLVSISANIWVARDSQKPILIGKGGEKIAQIGKLARKDVEKILDSKVFLDLRVKVRKGWSDDTVALRTLGYAEDDP